MSEIGRRRISKEAVDAVAAKPPRDTEQDTGTALRRYLGIELFQSLRRRPKATEQGDQPPKPRSDGSPEPGP